METLNVFFKQIRVGSLAINDRRLFSFQYSKEWLISPIAFQLSISLPLQEGILTDDKVKFFFSNLLPESAVRELIAKRLGISDKNDFMFLKCIGGECAGAITIQPESERPETPFIKEKRTNGTAISFSKRINISPKGFTQSIVNLLKPRILDNRAQVIPRASPMIIFQ